MDDILALLPEYKKNGQVIYRDGKAVIAMTDDEYDRFAKRCIEIAQKWADEARIKERDEMLWLHKHRPHQLDDMLTAKALAAAPAHDGKGA